MAHISFSHVMEITDILRRAIARGERFLTRTSVERSDCMRPLRWNYVTHFDGIIMMLLPSFAVWVCCFYLIAQKALNAPRQKGLLYTIMKGTVEFLCFFVCIFYASLCRWESWSEFPFFVPAYETALRTNKNISTVLRNVYICLTLAVELIWRNVAIPARTRFFTPRTVPLALLIVDEPSLSRSL